jgi:DNA-directed RNA polymerase subunit RPC12/RpoP
MKRVCWECLADLNERHVCLNCGSSAWLMVGGAGEIAAFSPEMEMPCEECGDRGFEVCYAQFRRVVGMILLDLVHVHAGYFCTSCRRRIFLKFQGLTLLLGWWGLLAMLFRNPRAIFSNFRAVAAAPALADRRNVITLRQLTAMAADPRRGATPPPEDEQLVVEQLEEMRLSELETLEEKKRKTYGLA